MNNIFYVYALFDVHGVVRYIGKGKNGRWMQHQADNRHRKQFVTDALLTIGDVPKIKIHENLDEFTAYSFESALIKAVGIHPNGPLVNKTENGSGPNSEQVKRWHANRTPEERRASMAKAIAKISPDVMSKKGRENALSIGRDALADRMKKTLASIDPEKLHEYRSNAGKASAKRRTPEEMNDYLADLRKLYMQNSTHEERSAAFRKGPLSKLSHEERSKNGKKGSSIANGKRTEEESRAYGTKGIATVHSNRTPEERRYFAGIAGKKGAAALSPEMRSAASKKRAASLGPERLKEIALKASETLKRRKAARSQGETN